MTRRHHHHHGRSAPMLITLALRRKPVPTDVCEVAQMQPNIGNCCDCSVPETVPPYPSRLNGVVTPDEFTQVMRDLYRPSYIAANWMKCFITPLLAVPLVVSIIGLTRITGDTTADFNLGISLMAVGLALTPFAICSSKLAPIFRARAVLKERARAFAAHPALQRAGGKLEWYEEKVGAVQWQNGSIIEGSGTWSCIRMTFPGRTLAPPQTWQTHGTVGTAQGQTSGEDISKIITPFGIIRVPASCMPAPHTDFVLVNPEDACSPVNKPIATDATQAMFAALGAAMQQGAPQTPGSTQAAGGPPGAWNPNPAAQGAPAPGRAESLPGAYSGAPQSSAQPQWQYPPAAAQAAAYGATAPAVGYPGNYGAPQYAPALGAPVGMPPPFQISSAPTAF